MRGLTVQTIFDKAQTTTIYTNLVEKLVQLRDKTPEEEFKKTFLFCLKVALCHGEKGPAVRVLDFISKFCAYLEENKPPQVENEEDDPEDKIERGSEGEEEDDPMNPFVAFIFKELLQLHNCGNQSVRMRACYCINKILQCLGPEASIDSDICDDIYTAMLDRLKDKSPIVRAHAVTALQRLQDPTDPECLVVKAFLFHLRMDPSAEVRRVVLACLGRSKYTLAHIRNRILDVKDTVRKQAYVSLSKVTVRSHSIKDRELILSQGLKDRSDIVRDSVEKLLLPNWFENVHENFMEFLHVLDVENSEIAGAALKILFRLHPKEKLLDCLDLDINKLVPSKKLTVESSFYWHCLTDFLQCEEDGQWELVLPELSAYCEYVSRNLDKLKEVNVDGKLEAWHHTENDFIVLQLLKITKVFDLGDEAGREKLKQLLLKMLMDTNVRLKLVPTIIDVLVQVIPDVNSRLMTLAETISEIHDPLVGETINVPEEERREMDFKLAQLRVKKNILEDDLELAVSEKKFLEAENLKVTLEKLNEELQTLSIIPQSKTVTAEDSGQKNRSEDSGILSKCLTIVYEMMQSPTVTTLSPELRSLMDNFVKNSLKVEHAIVQVLALQCLAVFALLDETMAKDVIVVFCVYLGSSCDEITLVAAKGIFDLLLKYGLKTFCISEEEDTLGCNVPQKKKSKKNLMRQSTIIQDSDDSSGDESFNESKNDNNGIDAENEEEVKKKYDLLSLLIKHLDTAEGQLLECVAEGLCKLLLAMRVSSPKLLSRLILLWFNPIHDDNAYLQQMLGLFFNTYAVTCPLSQETLEQCFLPTISTLINAPCSSPLYQVNVETVGKFLLDLTKTDVNRYSPDVNIHNNLALKVCNELLLDNFSEIGLELINLLCQMDLAVSEEEKINLKNLAERISKDCSDRASSRAIHKFINILSSDMGRRLSESRTTDADVTLNTPVPVKMTKRLYSSRTGSSLSGDSDSYRKMSRGGSYNTLSHGGINVIPETSESDSDDVFK